MNRPVDVPAPGALSDADRSYNLYPHRRTVDRLAAVAAASALALMAPGPEASSLNEKEEERVVVEVAQTQERSLDEEVLHLKEQGLEVAGQITGLLDEPDSRAVLLGDYAWSNKPSMTGNTGEHPPHESMIEYNRQIGMVVFSSQIEAGDNFDKPGYLLTEVAFMVDDSAIGNLPINSSEWAEKLTSSETDLLYIKAQTPETAYAVVHDAQTDSLKLSTADLSGSVTDQTPMVVDFEADSYRTSIDDMLEMIDSQILPSLTD